ncbi:MAG: helix-turn-helix domain-containing protein [Burkholderiaceae bacterium]|jgi:putative transcriptional regulator|nr:helix-turn-helix domain-containing protein [Burkholderiaceae bacterium]
MKTEKQLLDRDTGRDIGAELLEAVRQMKAGQGRVVYPPVAAARAASGLSQSQFAALLGVSAHTLQDWEQGRRKPSGAAQTLLAVATRHPDVLRELVLQGTRAPPPAISG